MKSVRFNDVTDTALWVAALRGREALRSDALFVDPLATLLAGAQGEALRKSIHGGRVMQWLISLRTVAIDRLVLRAIELGADTVVNLGAGMDTRPYRLVLPPQVRWIEVDYPRVIEHKQERLRGHGAACRVELVSLDLARRAERTELLNRIAAEATSIVVITEGVLPYLQPGDVDQLARDLRELERIRFWVQDYYNGRTNGGGMRLWDEQFRDAPTPFESTDWFAYFRQRGWSLAENIRLYDESQRLRRRPPFSPTVLLAYLLTRAQTHYPVRDRSGFALFERSEVTPLQ